MASGVVSSGVFMVIAAITYPLYLYFLGYETYGVWLILSITFSLSQMSSLGISPAVLKLVAEEYGRDDISAISIYTTTAIAACCAIGAVLLVVILTFKTEVIGFFRITGDNEALAIKLLPYMTVLSIYSLVVGVYNAALSGVGRMDLAVYCEMAGRVVMLTVASLFLYFGYGIWGPFYGMTFSLVAMHAMLWWFIRRVARVPIRHSYSDIGLVQLKRLMTFGSGMAGSAFVNMLIGPFNKIILSRYAGVATVPVFEIAFSGALVARGFIEAIVRPVGPDVSRLSAVVNNENIAKIRHIYRKVMGLVTLTSLPYYGLLIIFAAPLLQIWLGGRYTEDITTAFQICAVGFCISAIGLPAYYSLMGLGNSRAIFVGQIIQSVVNCTMVSAMVLMAGYVSIDGMSAIVALSLACSTLYMIIQNKKMMNMFSRNQPGKVS